MILNNVDLKLQSKRYTKWQRDYFQLVWVATLERV